MKATPCGSFEAEVTHHRCRHCGWSKTKHRGRAMAYCAKTGKVRHRTRASAAKQLHRLVLKPVAGQDPHTLMTYICNHCRAWHVGHSAGDDQDVATSHPRHQLEEPVKP